ncbi:hypothetical protein [Alkaliphilus peptidifermentans]|uniref:Uncharacterized protein n=1 Tax=Alkaliphilus peptidifermentans DSM 18978 TaxID=1120976 RepID=A0A1G5HSR7_9FIRM|nr:hypothetical protein [Alkaliphilus peptidifermentans]SCY66731.1 hypothetical protein SAMN03080606_02115 [Alkaliphilus peptidifermentans DSM 18978]
MEYINTGSFLLWEWFKTLIIFTLIDMFIIKRTVIEILKNHDTYISSLVVAAFLLIIRTHEFTVPSFLGWAFLSILIYFALRISYTLFMKGYK